MTLPKEVTELVRAGRDLLRSSRYSEARDCLKRALEKAEAVVGTESEDLISILKSLAVAVGEGFPGTNSEEVEPLERRAKELAVRFLSEEDARRLQAYESLAITLSLSGSPSEAIDLFRDVLDVLQRSDPHGQRIAMVHGHLADELLATGRADEALPHFEYVAEAERRQDPTTRVYVGSIVLVGICLLRIRRKEDAADIFERALKVLAEHHPNATEGRFAQEIRQHLAEARAGNGP